MSGDHRYAYAVTTWSGAKLAETLASIPEGARVLVVDNRAAGWPLARGWNFALDVLLDDEGHDAAIVMNDDVVLRPDTGDLLVWGLLEGQFQGDQPYESDWGPNRPELLLLSARHAAPSDACTDVPDWALLEAAAPRWQPGPDFATFCVGRKFREIVGRFDEGFAPAWFEDNDSHRRAMLAGFEAGALAPYWHFRNGTLRADPERLAVAMGGGFQRSQSYYARKWGAPDDGSSPLGRETLTVPSCGEGYRIPVASA